ncbi:hypothetical protein JS531_03740 [Bifidobacterium sp. CP2]|uniref:hypothetical protein n=1 Tax=Bifidobacterium sp. CP2 TaxID=2809025 RepID=UPI001BDD51E2|nr:hypothetical protein [Bifidobacterium sp. CP2]MBT1181095.1 hypothetical protein [Bifidobacterium sp. CP2]
MAESWLEWVRAENPRHNPHHWKYRGWTSQLEVTSPTYAFPTLAFDLPWSLFWMAVSGSDVPTGKVTDDTLRHMRSHDATWIQPTFCWRDDGWMVMSIDSFHRTSFTRWFKPVRPLPDQGIGFFEQGRSTALYVMRAPFPLTLDTSITLHSTCSLGHVDDPPFMPPYCGNPSSRMIELMNSVPAKPGYIVWNGFLHVWFNHLLWDQADTAPKRLLDTMAVSAPAELILFRAYKLYYEQLRRELPQPYEGPIVWPDQCDPRFPLPGDPRYSAYR